MNTIFKKIAAISIICATLLSCVGFASFAAFEEDTNILVNGGFENGLTGWPQSSTVSIHSGDAAGIYSGEYSAYASGAYYENFKQRFDVEGGKPYIASYMAKAASGTQAVMLALKNLTDSSNGHIVPFRNNLEKVSATLTTNSWTNLFYTFCPTSTIQTELYAPSWAALAKPIYMDDVYVGELRTADVKYSGARSTVKIPAEGERSTLTLAAMPYNQLGTTGGFYSEEVAGAGNATYEIAWALAEEYAGVSLEGDTLVVDENVSVSEILVEATATLTYPGVAPEDRDTYSKTFAIGLTQYEAVENMIVNGGFENGLTGWPVTSAVSAYSGDSANVYEGAHSAYLASGATYTDFVRAVDVTAGKTYIASYMAKAASGMPSVMLVLENLDAAEVAPFYQTALEPKSVTVNPDTWTNIFYTVTPTSSFTTKMFFPSWAAIDPIYLDDVYMAELCIEDMKYTGSRSAVTAPGAGQTSTITLAAEPYNQLGTKGGLYNEAEAGAGNATYEMAWALAEEYAGVSIDGDTLVVDENLVASEILVEAICTPLYPGALQRNFKKTFAIDVLQAEVPVANDVEISGTVAVGHTLTGNYTYYDANDDAEQGTSFAWMVCDTEAGEYAVVDGAETNKLVVTTAMRNKYIKFCVTPQNAVEVGETVESDPVFFYVDTTKDNNADVQEILVNGEALANFRSDRTTYEIEIPYTEGMAYPVVSATAKSPVATMTIAQADSFTAPAEITVTSENHANVKIYTLTFIYVGKDVITAENTIVNGSFEDGLTGWNTNADTVFAYTDSTENIYEGSGSVLLSNTGFQDFTYNATLLKGKTYLFSFMAKAETGSHKIVGSIDGFNDAEQAPFRDVVEPSWLSITSEKWHDYGMTYYPKTSGSTKIYITNWTTLPNTYLDNVYLGELLIDDIQYQGSNSIQIPQGDQEKNHIYLGAIPKNQLGTTAGLYSAEAVGSQKANYKLDWELAWEYPGVTLEGNKLSVTNVASQDTIEVKAICTPLYPGAQQTEVVKRIAIQLLPHNDPRPRATNVTVQGVLAENEVITAEYIYYQVTNEPEGESSYQWYYATEENGNYTEIPGETGLTYTVRREHLGGFIKFGVVPRSSSQLAGAEVRSHFVCAPKAPTAKDLTITGTRALGQTITGGYLYYDANNDAETNTTLSWWIADTKDGRYEPITGATTNQLTIQVGMEDKYIKFCVTPKNALETGAPVYSEPLLAATTPRVERVTIEKVSSQGALYCVDYDYVHPCGVPEGATVIKWYIGGSCMGTGAQFSADGYSDKTLSVRITPVASIEPSVGAEVEASTSLPRDGVSKGGSGGGGVSGRVPSVSASSGTVTVPAVQPTPTNRHWAQDAVDFVVAKGIMIYPAADNFQMDTLVTRAEFMYYVAKAAGLQEETYSGIFSDVTTAAYYAGMLQSAVSAGIISRDEKFYPERNVSREEICKIVTIAAKVKQAESDIASLQIFADRADMAEWALPYINNAVDSGLLVGVSDTEFLPKGMVTRAQTAVIIKRMMDSMA